MANLMARFCRGVFKTAIPGANNDTFASGWPQAGEVCDFHFGPCGIFFMVQKQLKLAARFPPPP
jgi:hypothetical protein